MKIIAVDDERHALNNILSVLSTLSLVKESHGFLKPSQALEFIKDNNVDVALLDIKMRGMSGLELAYHIKNISPNTAVIFTTGYKRYAYDAIKLKADGYILKPVTASELLLELEGLNNLQASSEKNRIRVQTFGNFDVFVDGKPVTFSRSRSKELLAYLVHKEGTGINKAELAAVLWEDKEYSRSIQQQLQVLISEMIKSLKAVSAEKMVIREFNNLCADTRQFVCDSYGFENWDINAINAYKGEYMAQYSWAEFKLGYFERHFQRISAIKE